MLEIKHKAHTYFNNLRWKYYFSIKLLNKTTMRLERRCEMVENKLLRITLENELERIELDEIREKIKGCHERMDSDSVNPQ